MSKELMSLRMKELLCVRRLEKVFIGEGAFSAF
jgi:hypothetical protein